jgi:Hypothetical protein (DUF2513)
MKRDMDLARRILLAVEADPEATGFGYVQVDIEGHDQAEVSYHIQLLRDAGLLEAKSLTTRAGLDWRPIRLTYAGHEFVEASRKDTLWQKAKTTVLEKTGGLSVDVLKALLLKMATDAVLGGGS